MKMWQNLPRGIGNWCRLCVHQSCQRAQVAAALKGSTVKVCTVVGFPLGASTSAAKAFETRDAIANGGEEIDMVINVGALLSGDVETVGADIQAVVDAAEGTCVKVLSKLAIAVCLPAI